MKLKIFLFCAVGLLLSSTGTQADVVLTTSSRNTADLDFDGAGTETDGDLGIASRTFVLTGSDIPADSSFDDITSITLIFNAAAGKTLSARGTGISPPGIGLTSPSETLSTDIQELSDGVGEILTVSVSSTSTNPNEGVRLSGIGFNSWRNFFPVSEVTLTGATFGGGQSVLTGGGGLGGPDPILIFDDPVDIFSVESTGADGIRMADIRLSVVTIPEPTSALISGLLLLGICCVRRVR